VFHVLLISMAAGLTVIVLKAKPQMMFEGKKAPSIPARKLQHRIRVKQMQKQSRKPQVLQRLASTAPGHVALPEMPRLPNQDIRSLQDPMTRRQAGTALGGLTRGGGAGRGRLGTLGYSDARFFGQNVHTRAVCILVDVSSSIVNKGVLDDVIREASEMLKKFNPATQFNLIVFVDGAEPYAQQMVYATQEHKRDAVSWIKGIRPNYTGNRRGYSGSTPSEALRMAVEMGCDTIFLLTDDPPYLKQGSRSSGYEVIESHPDDILRFASKIESDFGRRVVINTICYKPRSGDMGQQAQDFLKKLARRSGGRFKVVK
jgi:hypothetical protein